MFSSSNQHHLSRNKSETTLPHFSGSLSAPVSHALRRKRELHGTAAPFVGPLPSRLAVSLGLP